MYILDTTNYRVMKWQVGEPLGYVVAGGRGAGAALNQISTSYGMFVDQQNNIYVSDNANARVTLWYATNTTSGVLVRLFHGKNSYNIFSLMYRLPVAMVQETHQND